MNQPHTTAGTWFVTQYEANGEQLDFGDYLVEHNTSENPWETVDNYDSDYLDIGFKQQAERFVPDSGDHVDCICDPSGQVEVWHGDTSDYYDCPDPAHPFLREVRTRTKTECQDCAAGFVMDFGGPAECLNCQGTGWYWAEIS